MGHTKLINATDAPMKHPVSGQLIQPGQQYMVPDEAELKAQEKGVKAWEKARAKEDEDTKSKADADAKAKAEADAKAKAEADEKAKADADAKAKADGDAK